MPSRDHEWRDALPLGTVLRDFTIRAVIGHGGFGVVYRAEHNELDLTVAIKEYLPVELAVREGATVRPRSGTVRMDFEDGLRRFRDEAQVLVGFDSHPSIVSCRDFFRANGTAYLVMAYEDGQSLATVLARREAEGRPFTESDLLAVMMPLLESLARVHAAGVLHRDIKPSNILIRKRDERPVLIDFGAAKQATARFSKSQAPYTEGYAALEQVADAGKLGPWTDMYGLGAVMWRMVAGGNRPWEPPHPVRVELRSHAALGETEDPLPSARELGKGRFPPKLLEAIDRCLRLRETARIQGSSELLEALQAVSDQSPPAGSTEADLPLAKVSVASRQQRRSREVPAIQKQSAGWRKAGWLVLASLVVGLGLLLPLWWGPNVAESVQDEGSAGASGDPGGEVTAPERGEAFDTASTPNRRLPNRESTPEAKTTAQAPDPSGGGAGSKRAGSEAEIGKGNDDSLDMRPQSSQGDVVQPWIRDWDALDDINDPDFATTAQAYIERYKQVPEASVWVAQAEGLLAKLSEFEETLLDRGPDGVSIGIGGGVPAPERSGVVDSVVSSSQWPANRESPSYANGTGQVSDPTGTVSSRIEERSEAETGRDKTDSLKVRPQWPEGADVQPWIRDWDALDDINDIGFAATAQTYIEQYKEVPEANVWVARAEGLLAKLRELESPSPTQREAGDLWMNWLGMEFVWIAAGNFLMGSPMAEEGRDVDERQHRIWISEGFWIKKYEVTQGEWRAVMGTNPSYFSDCGPKCPVEDVSWFDTKEFILRLNGRASGKEYRFRLPTEAEWEFAARAGTTGPSYGKLGEIAWYRNNSGNSTQPVGLMRANAWGLHDMLGNVHEWTSDRYRSHPGSDAENDSSGSSRVFRGGSWLTDARYVRSANRQYTSPADRGEIIGFRLVRTD